MNGPIIAYRGNIGMQTSAPFTNTYSLDFDGIDDYLDVGSIAMVNSVNKLSFSVWIKTPSFATQGIVLGRTGSSSIYDSVYMRVITTGQIVFNVFYGAQKTVNSIALNTWTHIACVYDGSLSTNNLKAKIYINGILETNTSIGGAIPSTTGPGLGTNFNIGARGTYMGSLNFFNGNIDEVSLYDYSLSASEVTDIYNLGTPTDLSLLATPPLHWYRNGDNGSYKSPQWLIPNNENKDKVSNYSFEFDGVDDEVNCGIITAFGGATQMSMCGWFKANTLSGNEYPMGYAVSGNSFYLAKQGTTGNIQFDVQGITMGQVATNSANFIVGTWIHIVCVYDGSLSPTINMNKIYVNGILADTRVLGAPSPTSLATSTTPFLIGAVTGTANMACSIDEVAIFDYALTASDVTDIYNLGSPNDLSLLTTPPINYYKMGEDSTFAGGVWTVPDSVGSNNGTSANMTIEDRIGEAPNSSNNALSLNMDFADVVSDVPN